MQFYFFQLFSMTFKDILKDVSTEFHWRNFLFYHDDYTILACSPVSCTVSSALHIHVAECVEHMIACKQVFI